MCLSTNSNRLTACWEHARLGGSNSQSLLKEASIELARRLKVRSEWRQALEKLEVVPEEERDAEYLIEIADLNKWLGERRVAKDNLRRALKLVPKGSAQRATVWHQLAAIDFHDGKLRTARAKFKKAFRIRHHLIELRAEADTLLELAAIDLREGNVRKAQNCYSKVFDMRQEILDKPGEAAALHELASIDFRRREYQTARQRLGDALTIREAIGDRAGETATLHQLGSIYSHEGKSDRARQYFAIALSIRREIGDRAGEGATRHELASVDLNEAVRLPDSDPQRSLKFDIARRQLTEALEIRKRIGDRAGETATLHQLGSADRHQQHYKDARSKLEEALRLRRQVGEKAGVAATLGELAALDIRQRKYAEAEQKCREALAIWQASGDRLARATTVQTIGTLRSAQGDSEGALKCYINALTLYREFKNREGEAEAFLRLSELANKADLGDVSAALLFISFYLKTGNWDRAQTEAREYLVFSMSMQFPPSQDDMGQIKTLASRSFQEDRGLKLARRAFTVKHIARGVSKATVRIRP